MQRRSFLALSGSFAACGCSGAVHRLPDISNGNLALAQSEVRSASGPQRRAVSDDDVQAILRAVSRRIVGPALHTCHEMNVGVCDWKFRISSSRTMNASAWPHGYIVVNRGIVEYADNEEQVCLVIAHEIGHQAANHVATSQRNRMVGALVGGVLLGALSAAVTAANNGGAVPNRSAVELGARVGGTVGELSFSKEQEREADYLAALILYRSGVDLDRARGLLVAMAHASGRTETSFLDSHPAGPERVAGWDSAVAEIRASNGKLPARAF